MSSSIPLGKKKRRDYKGSIELRVSWCARKKGDEAVEKRRRDERGRKEGSSSPDSGPSFCLGVELEDLPGRYQSWSRVERSREVK